MDGTVGWDRAFDEYVRWMAPIGMSPRRIAGSAEIGDVKVTPGGRAFFMFGAANRDPAHFTDPDSFDITRDTRKHIAFGAGPHFCAGAFAARALVADVALPMMFARLADCASIRAGRPLLAAGRSAGRSACMCAGIMTGPKTPQARPRTERKQPDEQV